ncbi:glycoside hydrolase family protein [Aegicerativicinus sediminis]|uniref:family 43 glycosylhydrolase n=1 Tax=Aegicerativicinus sediminis TaxID=2893202 RepID=UPI001E2F38A2|nr:family 43 glycosylhydrolase [Aegicerativicinus sediminis]
MKNDYQKINHFNLRLLTALLLFGMLPFTNWGQEDNFADKPLFRDPIFDGAADPSVIWNKAEQKWFMFYTNRRANEKRANGVSWVHGTRIGIAESTDGAHWTYKDTANINYKFKDITYWAPDVLEYKGVYHMYLTIVPGIFDDWYHPRFIVHLTSNNLQDWEFESKLTLASDRCIDATVFQLPNGMWRIYYNNENDGKSIYYADSKDLYNWVDSGQQVIKDRGEGPKVFNWKNQTWMVNDAWDGLGVYSTEDYIHWTRQEYNLLKVPGIGKDDNVKGGHPDIVVNDGRAYVFYFTHPGRTEKNKGKDNYATRRSSIQVAELKFENGVISCNRDIPVNIHLKPPKQ